MVSRSSAKRIIQKELMTPDDAWSVYFLDNHDLPRHYSSGSTGDSVITCRHCQGSRDNFAYRERYSCFILRTGDWHGGS